MSYLGQQSVDCRSVVLRWNRAPAEVTIDGGNIPERHSGIDPLLADSLASTNSDMYFAVAKNICANDNDLERFVELANVAMRILLDERC